MRLIFVIFVALCLLFAPISSIAKKGASEKAFERASDKAKFKREKDWFDKTGKKSKEGKEIKKEAKEAEKEAKKAEKEAKKAEKEAEKAEKKAEKKGKKSKKKNKK